MKFDARYRAKSHCQALQLASNCNVISVTLLPNMTEMTVRFDADYKVIRCKNTASLNMISHCFLTLIS